MAKKETVVEKPDRVWAWPYVGFYFEPESDWYEGGWAAYKPENKKEGAYVEYVRADLLDAAKRDAKEAETYAQELTKVVRAAAEWADARAAVALNDGKTWDRLANAESALAAAVRAQKERTDGRIIDAPGP